MYSCLRVASFLAFSCDGVELPRDVRHHGVNVVAGLDAGRGEEAFRKPIEIRFAEHDRSVGLNDVGVEIRSQLRQFLAQLLNFLALVGRQLQTGTAIIAQCFLEQLFVFAGELWMRISECLDRLVNVLAIIDADRPVLERFHGVLSGSAHGGIRVRFLDDRGPVCRETRLVSDDHPARPQCS